MTPKRKAARRPVARVEAKPKKPVGLAIAPAPEEPPSAYERFTRAFQKKPVDSEQAALWATRAVRDELIAILASPESANKMGVDLVEGQRVYTTRDAGLAAVAAGASDEVDEARHWVLLLHTLGPKVVFDVQRELIDHGGSLLRRTNLASSLGDLFATAIKRHVILGALHASQWNISRAAQKLGMTGTGNILRAIRDVGLTAELEKAREEGRVTRAWNKPRKK